MTHEDYMKIALKEAHKAFIENEVPIGAIVVKDNEIIAKAHNKREEDNNPAGHAEFLALQAAAKKLNTWRLTGCTVYVTLEPCIMCAGLMHQARIDKCIYGAFDSKAGALGSLYQINEDKRLNHNFEVTPGILEEQCKTILKEFFKARR